MTLGSEVSVELTCTPRVSSTCFACAMLPHSPPMDDLCRYADRPWMIYTATQPVEAEQDALNASCNTYSSFAPSEPGCACAMMMPKVWSTCSPALCHCSASAQEYQRSVVDMFRPLFCPTARPWTLHASSQPVHPCPVLQNPPMDATHRLQLAEAYMSPLQCSRHVSPALCRHSACHSLFKGCVHAAIELHPPHSSHLLLHLHQARQDLVSHPNPQHL
mmetsp:Transcript_35484/g.89565  ORF Transcript_35484/g.89565 Transcript_35484/m.89565 type:complete len:218 (-) Transcript_35484:907-1560(-)